jgi:ribosomal subunit interface protein
MPCELKTSNFLLANVAQAVEKMGLQIYGTNTEMTPETQRYIERKLKKLDKHLPDIIDIKVEVADHPITMGVKDFTLHDETYKGMWFSPDITVLMKTEPV